MKIKVNKNLPINRKDKVLIKKDTTMRKTVTFLIIAFLLVGLFLLWPPFYIGMPLTGYIIDTKTKKPIEGVYVVADWELRTGATAGGSHPVGPIYITETTTDKEGKFHFDRWGPKLNKINHEILYENPKLIVLKDGYEAKSLYGDDSSLSPFQTSSLNNKTIKLEPYIYKSDRKSERLLYFLQIDLSSIYLNGSCDWVNIKNTLLEIDKLRLKIEGQGGNKKRVITPFSDIPSDPNKCDLNTIKIK